MGSGRRSKSKRSAAAGGRRAKGPRQPAASTDVLMACVAKSITTGRASYGLYADTRVISQSYRNFPRKSSYKYLRIRAVQGNDGRQRLVDIIRIIPELSRDYFKSWSRRALFGGISLLGGFYVAQTISLSFGALGVNDVIAAVVCVLLTEYVIAGLRLPSPLHSSTISKWVSHMASLSMPSSLLADLYYLLLGCFSMHSSSPQTWQLYGIPYGFISGIYNSLPWSHSPM